MFGGNIANSVFYKYRYWIGYSLIAAGLIAIIVFAGLYLPGGLSQSEIDSTVRSGSISHEDLSSVAITNLPYHLMQKASFLAFGVNNFSIKLPSMILALLAGFGLILLLKRWFKSNIAVLASLIAITTGQFIFIAQNGSPSILYLFWPVWLLLLATMISNKEKYLIVLKMVFFILAALSLYTPLSIYALIAMVVAAIVHPHLRFIVKNLSKFQISIAILGAVIILVPLVFALIEAPSLGLTLLGVPTQMPDWGTNFALLGAQYAGFGWDGHLTIMTPFFALGSTLIILIGIYQRIVKVRMTAKSYVIIIWIIMLIPVVVINPNFTTIAFLPLVLLLASGIDAILSYWYKLFPFNPYARVGGLIPIVVLVGALVISGADRYNYGYRYDPNIVSGFSKDLKLLPRETKNLYVSEDEEAFYQVVASHNNRLSVSSHQPDADEFIATKSAKDSISGNYIIKEIITDSSSNDADRFYIYKKQDK